MLIPFHDDNTRLYGYKDDQGQVVIRPVYDGAENFKNDVAVVQMGYLYGLIGPAGNIILPLEFDDVYTYKSGWVTARKKKIEYLFTSAGEEVLQLSDVIYWYPPEEGIIRVKRQTGWGCINLMGEMLIPFRYTSLGPCCNGWLSFYEDGRWGWLDHHGKIVMPAMFLEVGIWSSDFWWSRGKDGYTLYDFTGRIVKDEGWLKILLPRNGVAAVKTVAGWKYVDEHFSTLLQLAPLYEWVEHFSEGLAAVKHAGAWGFIDPDGKEVIPPAYRNVRMFNEGLAAVQKELLWGFINTAGDEVIPCIYHGVGCFHNGHVWVRDVWCEWYIDRQGNDVSERKYMD
jgi:hypothetical protein